MVECVAVSPHPAYCINLCEIKFHDREFTIDSDYARRLAAKREIFMEATSTRKAVFTTMISCFGVRENDHY